VGGVFLRAHHIDGVFAFSLILGVIWLLVSFTMKEPPYLSSYSISIPGVTESVGADLEHKLCQYPGIIEASVDVESAIIYLKIDRKRINVNDLEERVKLVLTPLS